ncbi:MAG: LnmK family bifunctional acyltransferase/decarboxylase [Pseudomonadota bacterium]
MKFQDVDKAFAAHHTDQFRLGMPHMSAKGVRQSWLLREACHRHWTSIAMQMGVNPSEFRDKSGARVLASVVACSTRGDANSFREDDLCTLYMVERPTAKNGWRSQLDLRAEGKSLIAEIVTSFARRNGQKNATIEAADLEDCFDVDRTAETARRASLMRTLGKRDRDRAAADTSPPHLSFDIDADAHLNGVGLVYFASIHDMVARAETNAVPELVAAYPMRNRRLHFFGNIDAGDTLGFVVRASVQAFSPTPSVVVQSHARRASDGVVIACGESIYGLE